MKKLQKIAFIVNQQKPNAGKTAELLAKIAAKENVQTKITDKYPLPKDFLVGYDACCIVGGDGTTLCIAEQAAQYNVAVIGINQGSLGFLSTCSSNHAADCFANLINGEYVASQRMLLECQNARGDIHYALNDVVVKHISVSRLISLNVSADQQFITQYFSDGIIFATPTGSTAYNLSAGGPVIYPTSEVFVMTPICPHTVSNRSVVFDHKTTITVNLADDHSQPHLCIDGQSIYQGREYFPVTIKASNKSISLLNLKDRSFFNILRAKLNWQ